MSHANLLASSVVRFIIPSMLAAGLVGAAELPRLYVDFSMQPDATELSAFDLCLLRADARVDLEAGHALGSRFLARVDIFEVAEASEAAAGAQQLGVPLLEGTRQGMLRLDATHPRWETVVVRVLAQGAAERGFDGFLLTGLDTISQDAERAAVLRVIAALDAAYPDKQVMLDGGFGLLSEARRSLDGMLFTGLAALEEADETLLQARKIREAARLGVRPYVVDFADPTAPAEIAARAARVRELGGVPFITTPALDGVNLGPLQAVSRRVLVLHSGAAHDCFTARVLHGSLEWLGHEIIYRDAARLSPADLLPTHIAVSGVIVDQSLRLSPDQEAGLTALVTRLAEQRVPLLLTGLPWESSGALPLGLRGTGKAAPMAEAKMGRVEMALLMEGGAVLPRTTGLRAIQAPEGARVILSVKVADILCDQVFFTSWGGVWLDPLALEAGPQVNPLPFLEAWIGGQTPAPVVDTTCQDGRRLLVSHISGEGFTSPTSLPGLPLAGEAMLERILSRHPLPFTVALCEGEVRGWTPGLEPRDAVRYEEAARALFHLPTVEAASHSFSRPADWTPGQFIPGSLNVAATDTRRGLEREIGGSLAYIHRQLLPVGRGVPLMLWPRGVRPSPEAVAFSRRMGVENAATVSSKLMPGSQIPLAPHSWGTGDSLQTLITDSRQDGDTLNAEAAIAEALRTGTGRWLAPVQVALTFHDAVSETSLAQVARLLDWCAAQPLQAITTTQYCRIVRDAARTRILQAGPDHWIIVNSGHARTLRLPASVGVPDMERSSGLSGYAVHGGQLYIHTLGKHRTELILRPTAAPGHLRLAASSARVEYLEAGSRRALLQVSDSRPVDMTFAGLAPGTVCQMLANGRPEYLMADPAGHIAFTVPSQAVIQLQIVPAKNAAMR